MQMLNSRANRKKKLQKSLFVRLDCCWAFSGSYLFGSLMVFLKDFFFLKSLFGKKTQQRTKKCVKLPSMYRVKIHFTGDIVKFSSSLCDMFRAIS